MNSADHDNGQVPSSNAMLNSALNSQGRDNNAAQQNPQNNVPDGFAFLSEEQSRKLLDIANNPFIADIVKNGFKNLDRPKKLSRLDGSSVFKSQDGSIPDLGQVGEDFSDHPLVSTSFDALNEMKRDPIFKKAKKLKSSWDEKPPGSSTWGRNPRNNVVTFMALDKHYKDLLTAHKFLTAIVNSSSKFNNECWVLIEYLLAHLVAAAQSVAIRKQELSFEDPAVRNAWINSRDRSLEELQRMVHIQQLAATQVTLERPKNSPKRKWVPKN
jgi:hypothetical protein